MGGLCSAPQPPQVNIDMSKVGELVQVAVEDIPRDVAKNEREYPDEIKKSRTKSIYTR